MRIAHITDSHIEIPEPAGAGRIADFERVISDINKLSPQPDLVIHTGDISHCDRDAEYQRARQMLERLTAPFHVIPGNKDRRTNMAQHFGLPEEFNHQIIDTSDWRLLLLDTLSEKSNKGAFCSARLGWLRSKLSACTKPVAIFMHHPSFEMSDNPYPFQFEDSDTAKQFNRLITGFDVVKGIFCGHAHRNTTGKVGNIPGMTLTAMSLDRRKGSYPPAADGKPIYQLIDFADDGGFICQLRVCL